jgi:Protein of unknown function (DUF4239)
MDFLLYCTTPEQIGFVVLIFGGGSVLGLYLVRWYVGVDRLRENHEIGAVTFGVLGAFYGLVLAFVIVASWERFDQAGEHALAEASALESLYKLGATFPDPMRTRLTTAVRDYTEEVTYREWTAMAQNRFHRDSSGAHLMWQIVLSYDPANAEEQMLIDKSIDQLNTISEARSLRYIYYSTDLPSVVWMVIYLGCAITIGFSYFFGSRVFRAQALMCATFATLLGITILAVLELAHPYQGTVTLSNEPYVYSLSRMDAMTGFKTARDEIPTNPQISQTASAAHR